MSGDQSAAGVVNAHNVAQGIPMEIVGRSHTIHRVLHTDDSVAATIILPPPLLPVKKKPPRAIDLGDLACNTLVIGLS